MTKKQRAEVLAKTNGHCGYCGVILGSKWHVDHMAPILRVQEYQYPYYQHSETKQKIEQAEYWSLPREEQWQYAKKPARYVNKGECAHPERDCFDNYMPACASCNINKGGADVETFRYTIANGVKSLNKSHAQYRMGKRFGLIEEVEKPVVFYFETLPATVEKRFVSCGIIHIDMPAVNISTLEHAVLDVPGQTNKVGVAVLEYSTSTDAQAVITAFNNTSDPEFVFDDPSGQQRQFTRGEILMLHHIGVCVIVALNRITPMPYPYR